MKRFSHSACEKDLILALFPESAGSGNFFRRVCYLMLMLACAWALWALFTVKAAVAEEKSSFTIGVPTLASNVFACRDKSLAERLVTSAAEYGVRETFSSRTLHALKESRSCYLLEEKWIIPLSVPYHLEVEGKILKVVTVGMLLPSLAGWDDRENMYLLITQEVVGSGINELVGKEV